MVKIGKSSNKLNHFLFRVCISLGHAASFTGLDDLYRTVKNHFPVVMRKKYENGQKIIFPIRYAYPLEEPSNETRRMLLKLVVYVKLICFLYKM